MVARQRQKFSPDRRGDLAWCNWRVKLNVHIGRHRVLSHMMLIVTAKCQLGGPPFSRSIRFLGFFCTLHVFILKLTSKSKEGLRSLDKDRLPEERFRDRRRPLIFNSTLKHKFRIENTLLWNPSMLLDSAVHWILLALLLRRHLGRLAVVISIKFLPYSVTIHLSAPKTSWKTIFDWLAEPYFFHRHKKIFRLLSRRGLDLICLICSILGEQVFIDWPKVDFD